jgi:hypothetical protein
MNERVFTLRIDTTGLASSAEEVQRLRAALGDRRQLHARLAVEAGEFTRGYLRRLDRHKTAAALGAKPSGHHARAAQAIEADSNAEAAVIRIPRSSGLRRAFQEIVIRPGSGKKFLTIPADKRTYGRRAGEFAPGVLAFAVTRDTKTPVLVFTDGSGVAYFLRTVVTQKQDRTLLPSDQAYRTITRTVLAGYLQDARTGRGGPA